MRTTASERATSTGRHRPGDIDRAIDDIVACKRLGRHVGHGVTLIHCLVGIAIEGIANAIGVADASDHPASKTQLQRLMKELNDLPASAQFVDKMRLERYAGLDIAQKLAHGEITLDGLDRELLPSIFVFVRNGLDWNIVTKRLNGHYDQLIATGFQPPVPSFGPMAFLSRRARSKMAADTLGALLTPALDAANEAGRRNQCNSRMKQITLAMLLYECDHGTLPPAYSIDAAGEPLHSWRVLLLPYLGQEELYKKIRLDEPWNSNHNQRFHAQEVAFYRCPSVSTGNPGQTTYAVVGGQETPFEAGKAGKNLADLGPEKQQLILLVERAAAVCWMDPTQEVRQSAADAGINVGTSPYLTTEPIPNGIASPHPGGANFGFRSGAVTFLSENIDIDDFRKLLCGTNRVEF